MSPDDATRDYRYDAFISYRHGESDGVIAERLHKLLESFRTPSFLVKAGALPRLQRVFRDREELPTSSDLSESILEALKSSRFMIVICSPRAMQSKWVSEEIKIFRALGRQKDILALLIDGEPSQAFPPSLIERRVVKIRNEDGTEKEVEQLSEPLAADIRAPNLVAQLKLLQPEALRILAPIVGCHFDDLRQRAQARARQRLIATVAAMAVVTALFAGLAGLAGLMYLNAEAQRKEASEQRTLALNNAALAKANQEKAEDNAAISEKRRHEGQVAEANRVAALSQGLTSSDRADLAAAVALDVVPRGDDRPVTAQLSAAIGRSLSELRMPIERGLGEEIVSIAVSPDGLWLATGDQKGVVRLLDPNLLTERFHFQPGRDSITSLKFSPDSKRILVAGSGLPVIWDLEKRQKLFELDRYYDSGVKNSAPKALFSPDGALVVVATSENLALVYDSATGAMLRELKGPTFEEVIEGYPEGDEYRRWLSNPTARNFLQSGVYSAGLASDVAFSPDGSLIAMTGSINPLGTVWVFNTHTGNLVRTLRGQPEAFSLERSPAFQSKLSFSADGAVLVAAPTGKVINAWSVNTGTLKSNIAADRVASLVLTKDGRGVISGQGNGNIVVHCIDGASSVVTLQSHASAIQTLMQDSTGTLLVSASADRTARVWVMPEGSEICMDRRSNQIGQALARRRPIAIISGHNGLVTNAVFSGNSEAIITSSQDKYVRNWVLRPADVARQEPIAREKGVSSSQIYDIGLNEELLISDDSRTVFNLANDNWFAWDTTNNKQMSLGPEVFHVATGNANKLPVLFGGHLVFQIFNSETFDRGSLFSSVGSLTRRPEEQHEISWRGPVAPSGAQVVVKGKKIDDKDVPLTLVETSTGKTLATLAFKNYEPRRFFFSPDGTRLFVAFDVPTNRDAIILSAWATSTGDWIAASEISRPRFEIKPVSSRDGRRILLTGSPGSEPSRLLEVSNKGIRELKLPTGAVRSITMTASGVSIVAGYNDGVIATFTINSPGFQNILDTRGHPIVATILSPDDKFLAAVDASNTLWIFEFATGLVLRSYTMSSTPLALKFFPDGSKVAVVDPVGSVELINVMPGLPGLHDPQALADWMRATRLLTINTVDQKRYGVSGLKRIQYPALDAIQSPRLKPNQPITSPGPEASACDKLADSPYDRDRRTGGVPFERLDASSAQKLCDEALTKFPEDLVTQYHVARIRDRLGMIDAAMEGYRKLGEDGYAAAMRGVARLIDLDHSARFADLGASEAWMDRAAIAGDAMAYILIATRIATAREYQNNINQILSHVETAGYKNRSEALMIVATWLGLENEDPEKRRHALFFEVAALELYETMKDAAPFKDQSLPDRIRQSVRRMGTQLPPQEIVKVYREVRSWASSNM